MGLPSNENNTARSHLTCTHNGRTPLNCRQKAVNIYSGVSSRRRKGTVQNMQPRIHYKWRRYVPESKANVCFCAIVLVKNGKSNDRLGKIMYGSTTGTAGRELRNLRKRAMAARVCPTALFNKWHSAEKLSSLVIQEVMAHCDATQCLQPRSVTTFYGRSRIRI